MGRHHSTGYWAALNRAKDQARAYLPDLLEALCGIHEVRLEEVLHGHKHRHPERNNWAHEYQNMRDHRPSVTVRERAARWDAVWVLREAGLSLPGIGELLGLNHTSVLYALRRLDAAPPERLAHLAPLIDQYARTSQAAS